MLFEPLMNILIGTVVYAIYLVIGQQSFFPNSCCFHTKTHPMQLFGIKLNLSALFISLSSMPYL